MSEKYVEISTDPFSRMTLIRKVIHTTDYICSFCGYNFKRRLFIYGVESPMKRVSWEQQAFCGKPCRDSYHGSF